MAPAPLIGINANYSRPDHEQPWMTVRANYVEAVARAGGVPLVLPPHARAGIIAGQVARCDGFVFTGGSDLNPALFGQERHAMTACLTPTREEYDLALIRAVLDAGKPFLAVCLGCQEVNVVRGGTLVQDIHSQVPGARQHSLKQAPYLVRHEVVVEPGSRLAGLVGDVRVNTNSAHHQSIAEPGRGLRVVARCADDGVVEAVELTGGTFGLAIQWHPEYLAAEKEHLALFQGLVAAAAAAR